MARIYVRMGVCVIRDYLGIGGVVRVYLGVQGMVRVYFGQGGCGHSS